MRSTVCGSQTADELISFNCCVHRSSINSQFAIEISVTSADDVHVMRWS